MSSPREDREPAEEGSAIAEFVLVASVLVLVVSGLLQLTLALHVRNTLVDAAGEGARHGALSGSSLDAGAERTRYLISSAVADRYAEGVTARRITLDGMPVVEINVSAPVPVLGLLGPGGTLHATGHAVLEAP